ncbi:MAG: Na+-dependent transporter [Acidobacteria bacterium]|nr:Na+-dependent transporter [Acidobacteriota bacterium]
MSLAALIPLVMKVSIFLTVFSLALHASVDDTLYLLRRPSQLLRSMISMNVIMPLIAAFIAASFHLHPAVEIALIALAVSPVPPVLPKKATKVGGIGSYAYGLLVAAALLSIVLTPLAVNLVGKLFGRDAAISPVAIAQIILVAVLLPLAAGIAVRHLAPDIAERIAKPISLVATVMLLAAVIPILFGSWHAITSLLGNGAIVAIASFVIGGLLVGLLFGGPDENDRSVLALSTASRHPGVAMAIASANFPDQKLVFPAILLYLIINMIVGIPYQKWRKRHSEVAGITSPSSTTML